MRAIGVDPYGIKIMFPKATGRVILLEGISGYAANILKQDLLSLGADAAVPRAALLSRKKTNCLIFAHDAHLKKLLDKLHKQPSELKAVGKELAALCAQIQRKNEFWQIKSGKLLLKRCLIMGIVNATPDSFSGDGLFRNDTAFGVEKVIRSKVSGLIRDGADILDIGGESARPGSRPVGIREELERVLRVMRICRKYFPKVPLSVDTRKSEVAHCALAEGAAIVNDITGLRDEKMRRVIARQNAGVVLMHMQGNPLMMQKNPRYRDVLAEVFRFFSDRIRLARESGIDSAQIVLDPGIGFGKRLLDNMQLIRYLYTFKSFGMPLLIGASRKSFLGILAGNQDPSQRIPETLAAHALSIAAGAQILRVHDVREAVLAARVAEGILQA